MGGLGSILSKTTPGILSALTGITKAGAKAQPFATAGLAAGAASILPGLVSGAGEVAGRLGTGRLDRAIGNEMAMRAATRAAELRAQRQQIAVRENLARLAAYAPDVYNSYAAGRVLPRNAVRIGGTTRMDLLSELAMQMADGHFGESDPLAGLV